MQRREPVPLLGPRLHTKGLDLRESASSRSWQQWLSVVFVLHAIFGRSLRLLPPFGLAHISLEPRVDHSIMTALSGVLSLCVTFTLIYATYFSHRVPVGEGLC